MTISKQAERFAHAVLHAPDVRDDQRGTAAKPPGRLRPAVGLRSIASVEELRRRPCRPVDHAAENRALVGLMQEQAAAPQAILEKLAHATLALCRAHSAGVSLLEEEDHRWWFHWRAIAGRWAAHVGGGTPRDFGPCAAVLDHNEALLFSHPERDFACLARIRPSIDEGLLVPFAVCGEPIGVIWAVAHDESRRFDAEDLRVMGSLGAFAASACRTLRSLDAARAAEQRARESAAASALLASIVSCSSDAIASQDLDGRIRSWNRGAERLFGYAAEEIVGNYADLLLPDGHAEEQAWLNDRVRRGKGVESRETVRRRKDGSLIEVALSVAPVTDAEGKVTGASSIARDISEGRIARERQDLLLRESSHRVKNLFAVAGSLLALSARSARSPQELACSARERFAALTHVHDLIRPGIAGTMQQASETTTLHTLIRTVFMPYADGPDDDRLVLRGPDVPVGGTALTNAALLFHELTTNAAKHGALAAPEGAVHVDCVLQPAEVLLTWRESGGPPLEGPPTRQGFGLDFVRRITKLALCGQIGCAWPRDGLIVRMSLPVAVLRS